MRPKRFAFFFLLTLAIVTAFVLTLRYYAAPAPKTSQESKPDRVIEKTEPVEVKALSEESQLDPNPHVQNVLVQYEAYLRLALDKRLTPGLAVAILRDTSIIFLKGMGLRKAGEPDSVDTHTVFRVGSVSKSITATLVAKLVDDRFLSWDDPVIKFLPAFKLKSEEYTRQLSVRHVLSHTMGLPYHAYTSMIEERTPLDTLIAHLKDLDLHAAPGKMYSYQNVGFSLIQQIVETSGATFEQVLKERLFDPLQMRNASASYHGILSAGNVAMPHHYTRSGWRSTFISDTYYNSLPAGGINCSIADLAFWLRQLNSTPSDFWASESRDELFKPQVKAIARNRNFWIWQRPRASYYGLGWRVITFKNDTLYYHGGYVNGYRSEVAIHPKSKMAIAVLTNAAGYFADQSVPQFFKMIKQRSDSIQSWDARHPSNRH